MRKGNWMHPLEEVELTNMCMIYRGRQVLVENRKNPAWAGITFPGGHVEPNEAFNDAMVREVYEETGLKLIKPRLCGIKQFPRKDGKRYLVLLYKCDQFTGQIKSSREGDIFWIDKEKINDYQLPLNFKEMLPVFADDNLSEIYFHPQANGLDSWITDIY